jgi:hypothetical protein
MSTTQQARGARYGRIEASILDLVLAGWREPFAIDPTAGTE